MLDREATVLPVTGGFKTSEATVGVGHGEAMATSVL